MTSTYGLRPRSRCAACSEERAERVAAGGSDILPIHVGGLHTAANVQLAHYGCNSAKRDRAQGEQLRLLG
jgi:5-methylcytosine-specific restriction endonuclease McrA